MLGVRYHLCFRVDGVRFFRNQTERFPGNKGADPVLVLLREVPDAVSEERKRNVMPAAASGAGNSSTVSPTRWPCERTSTSNGAASSPSPKASREV